MSQTELFYIIKCQYVNRRGGGYLVELRADGPGFRLRRQGHEAEPDQALFRGRQIDTSRPYVEKQILAADVVTIDLVGFQVPVRGIVVIARPVLVRQPG